MVMTVIEESPWASSSYCAIGSGDRLKYLIGFFVSVMSLIAFPLSFHLTLISSSPQFSPDDFFSTSLNFRHGSFLSNYLMS